MKTIIHVSGFPSSGKTFLMKSIKRKYKYDYD